MNKFTFIVISYNHEKYILEHLESIKYLIVNYAKGIKIDLIVADDGSSDDTMLICKAWVTKNSILFNKNFILFDGINRGTCENIALALEYLDSKYCKLTASDDVYSYENLFMESKKIDNCDLLSGLPLNLVNGKILHSQFDLFNLYATNIIYKKINYVNRLKQINFVNAPSLIYNTKALRNLEVVNFMRSYNVTEDYPLHIKMAEIYSPLKFTQVDKIFIYYRRTSGSTYITKHSVFSQDKVAIYNYLISSESHYFKKLLLKNRLYCFNQKNKYLKKVLNLSIYIYGLNVLVNFLEIVRKSKDVNINYLKHQNHYNEMQIKAERFVSSRSI
jgi:glycosyltransferase involved in cell wall biosynthesis